MFVGNLARFDALLHIVFIILCCNPIVWTTALQTL